MRFLFLSVFLCLFVAQGFSQDITVQLTSPRKNAEIQACNDIQLAADVTGPVRRVNFYVNGSRFRAVTRAPFETTWQSVPNGIYEIYAVATDTANVDVSTNPIFIYVGNVQPGNIIINGEFNCSLAPWRLDNYVNAQSTATVYPDLWLTDDSSGVRVEIENQGDEVWAIQLMQPFAIQEGHTYDVSFWAVADEPKDITVDISKNYDDYAPLFSNPFTIDDLDIYSFSFTATADDDNLMFKFVLGGNTTPIEIDAVNVIDEQWSSVEQQKQTVTTFELNQNYPNPFNPKTTITYSLSNAGPVTLSIYNILGQPVRSFSETATAGNHRIVWDGTTSAGLNAPSGLYFYRLKTRDGSLTRKMHLLR